MEFPLAVLVTLRMYLRTKLTHYSLLLNIFGNSAVSLHSAIAWYSFLIYLSSYEYAVHRLGPVLDDSSSTASSLLPKISLLPFP